jgi:hypothetical protein
MAGVIAGSMEIDLMLDMRIVTIALYGKARWPG